ncbi:MAG: ComF family protein [Hyphomicrobiales bacterium]|nr:ComF family protein [Hyphomicrobiales bacterium]
MPARAAPLYMSGMIDADATEDTPQPLARRAGAAAWAWAASTARYAADLILPPVCIACREPVDRHGALCPSCWTGVEFIRDPVCERLGTPLNDLGDGVRVSAAALADPPAFGRARAAVVYAGVARRLVHALKYEDRHEGVGFLARLTASAGAALLLDADVVAPIPLSRARLRARRFNQAAELGRRVARIAGKPFEPLLLQRIRDTPSQVGLSHARRRANVEGAFAVTRPARAAGRRIVLIDDVITTGATANACAGALLASGAFAVDVLALALVPGSPNLNER